MTALFRNTTQKFNRPLVGWCLFDVANSSYTTLIITVAFNVIFTSLIVGPSATGSYAEGNALWAWALAGSWAMVALLGPYFGSLSDERRWRKKLLIASVALCAVASSGLYFVRPGDVWLAILLVVLSNIGFSFSENFISAFLPSLASKEAMGRISGLAWGLGYLGGLAAIVLCSWATGLDYRMENWERLRWVGPLTAAFFITASLPALFWLKEPQDKGYRTSGFELLFRGFVRLRALPNLARLLFSFFFFQGGLGIAISFAAIYGQQVVGLDGQWQAIFFISLQLTAAAGALGFGWLQSHIGGIRTLNLTLVLWVVTLVLIYALDVVSSVLGIADKRVAFVMVGNLAGLGLGATQACTRALVGQMAPQEHSGEVFGLWGFAGKLAMVFSLIGFGALQAVFSLQAALLLCCGFFIIPLILNHWISEVESG